VTAELRLGRSPVAIWADLVAEEADDRVCAESIYQAGCACKADPPVLHGLYRQWSRKIDGKALSRWLSPEQSERYDDWFANAKRLRSPFTALEALSLRIAERTEVWDPQAPSRGHRDRSGARSSATGTVRQQGKR